MPRLDYESLLPAGEEKRFARYKEQAYYPFIEICAALVGIAVGIGPIYLPIVAAKGAALIASHKVGLSVDLLVSGVRGLIEGKAPREIAKDMIKDLAISTLVVAPLEDGITQWLEAVKALLPRI